MLPENEREPIEKAELDRRVQLLREALIFAELDEDALTEIAKRLTRTEFERGTVIIQEGDPSDKVFFIFRGKIKITRGVDEKTGKPIELAIFDAGDLFGIDGLYFKRPRSATAVALSPMTVYVLGAADYDWMMQTYDRIKPYLDALLQTHEIAQKLKIDWLGEGEFILLITRRHPVSLFGEILSLSLFVAVDIVLLLALSIFLGESLEKIVTILHALGIGLALLAIIGITWAYLDWRNDYFIVTNVRVSWRERILFRSTSRQETPLRTIQSLNIQTRNILHRWMQVGDLIVRTFNSELHMTDVNHPVYMKNLIQGFILRSKRRSRQAELAQIRQMLRERLNLKGEEILPEEPETAPPIPAAKKKRFTAFRTRVVEGNTITYRKHWWIFFKSAMRVNLVFFTSLLVAFACAPTLMALGHDWAKYLTPSAGAIALISSFFWLYAYIDWRNDLYRITGDLIIDREKKPLGAESSRSAPIKNIQSLHHEVPNLFGLMLNVGNVYINVGDDTFNFRGVHNPALVHQDISRRMEELVTREEQERIKQEHERMATWLEIYHEETEEQRFPWRDLDL
jgi:hypothetical protein